MTLRIAIALVMAALSMMGTELISPPPVTVVAVQLPVEGPTGPPTTVAPEAAPPPYRPQEATVTTDPPVIAPARATAVEAAPAAAPAIVVLDSPLAEAPAPPPPPPAPAPAADPACDGWCVEINHAYEALAAGELRAVVEHAAAAYGIPEWGPWGIATVNCETGATWDPNANSGYYLGWTQQDPGYWPARAAAAGFPGSSPTEPVAAVGTMFSMVRAKILAGYGQPWIDWPNCGRNAYRVIG